MTERESQRRQRQRWLSINDVCRETGLSRSTVYRTPELRPVKMGKRRALWQSDEVEQFIKKRIAERDAQVSA